jgi:ABC-type dipeptide/oligopeptide/nickel transport system ATPase component
MLNIINLSVQYRQDQEWLTAVNNVSMSVEEGESLALVGESGCGKSTLALSIMGLLPERESRIPSGEIHFNNLDLLKLSKEELRKLRGKKMAMIFQDPFSALNPVMTINEQMEEIFVLDEGRPNPQKSRAALEEVQLTDPTRILSSYPHQLSGGQRQRVMIAFAIARKPDLLIAGEPTTALDVLVQDEIVKLLVKLQKERHMAMIFVTHNLGLVKNIADRVVVMNAGQIVEVGKTEQVLRAPTHPYTQNLLKCVLKMP